MSLGNVSHVDGNRQRAAIRDWHEVLFVEDGWDNHRDVYAFSNLKSECRVISGTLPEKIPGKWRPFL